MDATTVVEDHLDTLSRRGFLTGVGMMAAVAAAATSAPQLAFADEAQAQTQQEEGPKKIFDGVNLAQGHIVHDPNLCAGCRTCEIVCSLSHHGKVDRHLSNIFITTDWLGGYISKAEVCKQCAGAECVAVCPTKALHVDEKAGARVVDPELCVGCRLCENACPVEPSRIHYNARENVCGKCDLCGGEPLCVAHCPTQALHGSWEEITEDDSAIQTASGIMVNVALTGGIIAIAPDAITLRDINAEKKAPGVVVFGALDSTYSQPFTAKIKASFFDAEGETLYFSERLEEHVDTEGSITFEDSFETAEPDRVATINLEVMCGKIAG